MSFVPMKLKHSGDWNYREHRRTRKSETATYSKRQHSKQLRSWLAKDLSEAVEAFENPDPQESWDEWGDYDPWEDFDFGPIVEGTCPVCGGPCIMD